VEKGFGPVAAAKKKKKINAQGEKAEQLKH